MKKFLFLTIGFEKPSPEAMGEWQAWFGSMGERIVEQGGLWNGGKELTADGVKDLPFGADSITGYLIFTAESAEQAEELAKSCPVVASNRVYEIKRTTRPFNQETTDSSQNLATRSKPSRPRKRGRAIYLQRVPMPRSCASGRLPSSRRAPP